MPGLSAARLLICPPCDHMVLMVEFQVMDKDGVPGSRALTHLKSDQEVLQLVGLELLIGLSTERGSSPFENLPSEKAWPSLLQPPVRTWGEEALRWVEGAEEK